jgi:hypothetical protein
VRLPSELPAQDEEGRSDLRQLGDWFLQRAQEIARRFDARNGTDEFQQQINELPELLELATD